MIRLVKDPVDGAAGEGEVVLHGDQLGHREARFELARAVIAEPRQEALDLIIHSHLKELFSTNLLTISSKKF